MEPRLKKEIFLAC